MGYDRRKDDLVVCPDILTKLPPEEVKQLHERYLRSKCFYAGVFDRIASTGKVRVGISIDINSPFVCLNETKGELMGFDVELVGKVIESLGKNVKPEFLAYQWTGLFEALRDNDVDLAISAISRSPNREKDFDFQFSRRYYATSQSYTFFSKHAVPNIGNLKRTGRRLIVHRHTTSLSLARTLMPDIDIDMVDSPRAAFEWLIQIDPRGVVVTDSEIARYLEKKLGRALTEKTKRDHGVLKTIPINMVGHQGGEQHFEDEYGIAVKDRGLLAKVNEELEKFDKSGDLGTLRTKWLSNKPTPCEK